MNTSLPVASRRKRPTLQADRLESVIHPVADSLSETGALPQQGQLPHQGHFAPQVPNRPGAPDLSLNQFAEGDGQALFDPRFDTFGNQIQDHHLRHLRPGVEDDDYTHLRARRKRPGGY